MRSTRNYVETFPNIITDPVFMFRRTNMKWLRRTNLVTNFSSLFVLTVLAWKERMLLRSVSQSPNSCQLFLFRHALQYGQTIHKTVAKNQFLEFPNRKTHSFLFSQIFECQIYIFIFVSLSCKLSAVVLRWWAHCSAQQHAHPNKLNAFQEWERLLTGIFLPTCHCHFFYLQKGTYSGLVAKK